MTKWCGIPTVLKLQPPILKHVLHPCSNTLIIQTFTHYDQKDQGNKKSMFQAKKQNYT